MPLQEAFSHLYGLGWRMGGCIAFIIAGILVTIGIATPLMMFSLAALYFILAAGKLASMKRTLRASGRLQQQENDNA